MTTRVIIKNISKEGHSISVKRKYKSGQEEPPTVIKPGEESNELYVYKDANLEIEEIE
jgi:hypothetical protein